MTPTAKRPVQFREFRAALEVVDAPPEFGEGRLVCGQAVPYDSPVEILDAWEGATYTEDFRRGAFAKTINEGVRRVKFLVQHSAFKLPSGHARTLEERTTGLYAELYASRIPRNDEVLELIRDGTLGELSVGFIPIPDKDQWNEEHTHVTRTEVRLMEISIVNWGAYGTEASVVGLRELELALRPGPVATPNLARVRALLAQHGIKV